MFAQAPSPATPAQPPHAAPSSVLDLVVSGGLSMIPIIACSLVALSIIIERALSLRASRVSPPSLVATLKAQSADPNAAIATCRADASPLANILAVAIKERASTLELREKRVEETAGREAVKLRLRMKLLSALPQVSTMLGLLGTVFGMIKTFQAVAASSEALGKTELLAKGIHEAWTATAAGILVAIPVLIAYNVLSGMVESRTAELERTASEWLEHQQNPPSQAGVPTVAASPAPRVDQPALTDVPPAAVPATA